MEFNANPIQIHDKPTENWKFFENHIQIHDKSIVAFYKDNPTLDIVSLNHIFIDIIKNLSSNLSNTINTNINSKILSVVSDIQTNIHSIKTDIILRLHESKKEYIDDVKTILCNNALTNNEKINTIIEKNNDSLINKTTLIINDIIPKSQDKNYLQIETCIKNYCSSITNDTTKILELNQKEDMPMKTIVDTIETHFSKLLTSVQQPIFSFINASEERTNNNILQVKDNLCLHQSTNLKLTNELNDFLNKYKNNSSTKGNVSEAELYYMIQSILPTDEIIKVSGDTATCDIKVNRANNKKSSILFENKDYGRSVTTDEVKKFERDVQTQKIHGIFISQNSPITFKENFQIDIINNLIHIYIPNAEYSIYKLKIAIDIIDNLSLKLNLLASNESEEYSINKDDMTEIIEEYRLFVSQKIQFIDLIKTVTKQLTDKMEEIQFPKLKKLFINTGNVENDNDFKCSFCNSYSGKNKASLAAHLRNCKLNPKCKELIDIEIIPKTNNISPTIAETPEPLLKRIKAKK
jgi:hypothetical protein